MAKKAVLIGINYPGTKAELKGCINDVWRMHRCLVHRFGFSPDDIEVLIDTDPSYTEPTGKNIRRSLNRLVQSAEPLDFLFVHYSGHGTRLPAETGEPDDTGYDECIVPCDMNLITDEDFKELICQVPESCKLTIVSDSCHSGGLISNAKEQIGESTKSNKEEQSEEHHHGLTSFLKQTMKDTARDAFESRGIQIPSQLHRHHHHHHQQQSDEFRVVEEGYEDRHSYLKSKSLPLSTLIEILKQKTGKDDIDVGKLRPTLFDIFGDDASPKVKKFMKVILNKLQHKGEGEEGGGLLSIVGSLAQEFMKHKLEENESYAEPALATELESSQEAYAGSAKRDIPENGILLSGCQTDQTSADATPQGGAKEAYGAFSNVIQTIIAESGGEISNRELVLKARELLERQGFTQRPGLYCCDQHADAPFVC